MAYIAILNILYLCMKAAQADNPLDHFDWRSRVTRTNHTVPWMAYVNILIQRNNFNQLFDIPQSKLEILNIECVLKVIQNENLTGLVTGKYRKLLEPAGSHDNFNSIVKYLSFHLYVFTAEKLQISKLTGDKMSLTRWQFVLDKKLRSQITVEKLVIYSTFHEDRCKFNAAIKSHDEFGTNELFTLCGIYSDFVYYSPSNKVLFSLRYYFFWGFNCSVKFDISSVHVISHVGMKSQKTNYLFHGKFVSTRYRIKILPQKRYMDVFSFMVEKYNRVALRLVNNIESLFFDGPGFKVPKQLLKSKIYVVKSSTFQAWLQILANDSFSVQLQYRPIGATINKETLVEEPVVRHPILKKSKTQPHFDLFYFETFPKRHINVSVSFFQYHGFELPECQFGGITFFDPQIQTQAFHPGVHLPPKHATYPKVITAICDPTVSTSKMLQNIFSISHQLIIAVYSYPNYSYLNTTLIITSTPCRVARVHLCAWPVQVSRIWRLPISDKVLVFRSEAEYRFNLTNAACSVLQFTTDIHANTEHLLHNVYTCSVMCRLTFALLKNVDHALMYMHDTRGFLFDAFSTNADAEQQFFSVAGKDVIHDPLTDVSVTDWDSKGIPSMLSHSELSQLYTTNEVCFFVLGFCPRTISSSGHKSRTFRALYHSVFPSHERSAKYTFSGVKGRSWLDIILKPSIVHKASFLNPRQDRLALADRWTEVTKIKDDLVLVLNPDKDEWISELNVKIQMQVNDHNFRCFEYVGLH